MLAEIYMFCGKLNKQNILIAKYKMQLSQFMISLQVTDIGLLMAIIQYM